MQVSDALAVVQDGQSLSEDQAFSVLDFIFSADDISDDELACFLSALHQKGETVDEVLGFSRCLRQYMTRVNCGVKVLDVCGTGGLLRDRFNISTAMSFLLGSMGVSIAKHGNNGSKRANGSFDFLDALGVPYCQEPKDVKAVFDRCGLVFLYAKWFHPIMKKVGVARQKVPTRTVFNLMGPLCNPASVSHQLIGTLSETQGECLAEAAHRLGHVRTYVVVGAEVDEVAVSAESKVIVMDGNSRSEFIVVPDQYGLASDEPLGGLATQNALMFQDVLARKTLDHAVIKSMLLNAAIAAHCMDSSLSLDQYVDQARDHVLKGRLSRYYDEYGDIVREIKGVSVVP